MRRLVVAMAVAWLLVVPAAAESLHVIGAGSLTAVFTDLIRRFPAGPDEVAAPQFGPSGLMREAIESGAPADLFASADMDQARRLGVGYPDRAVINFTRNRLCALARAGVGLTPGNMLARLLDPAVRVATSTPGADPGGDYAWQVFARADSVQPGARATLEGKALQLVGGGAKTPLPVPGKGAVEGVFLADRADVMLGYCSGSNDIMQSLPGLVSVPMPPELTVGPAYGMVLLDAKPVALRFAAFVMSETGQAVLRAHGFDPVGSAAPAEPWRGVLVQVAGQPSALISPERLGALKPLSQRAAIGGPRGDQPPEWTGPLLWDVLVATAAVDPAKHADQVRQTVRVTGGDGYAVTLAMAELSPEFAGHPVLLATALNGAPLPGGAYRLVVPGEHRAGRSVRDVIRIDIQ